MSKRSARPAGPSDACSPPRVAGPAVERVTRFTFAVIEPRTAAAATAKREALIEHVEGLLGGRIVAEHRVRPGLVWVAVATSRPVLRAAAEDHAKEWPGYVAGSFRLGGLSVAVPPAKRRRRPGRSQSRLRPHKRTAVDHSSAGGQSMMRRSFRLGS